MTSSAWGLLALHWLIGTVGRMHPVKDQVMLAHAFVQ